MATSLGKTKTSCAPARKRGFSSDTCRGESQIIDALVRTGALIWIEFGPPKRVELLRFLGSQHAIKNHPLIDRPREVIEFISRVRGAVVFDVADSERGPMFVDQGAFARCPALQ